jgi:hypothetical protein
VSDIGYYTIPVICSFKGVTGQVQDDLNKAFKGAGENAGKIMVQSATDTFAKDPALAKAIQTGPASMDALSKATDKQTAATTKLRTEEKKLSVVRGTSDHRIRDIRQQTVAHTELAQSIKKVNDEQKIAIGTGGKGLGDSLKDDLGKALGGDTNGALSDVGTQLGKAIGAKVGTTLRDTVQSVTGMSVDTITDKVKSSVGVDIEDILGKALKGDRAGALGDLGTQLGTKAGTVVSGQVKDLTGIDLGLGGAPGSLIQQYAPGAVGAAADWATSGGIGDALDWIKGGGIRGALTTGRQALGSLRTGGLGGVRGALGNLDPKSLLGGVNDLTGGGAQPVLDMQGGINDLATGLLGGTAAERVLPAISEAALPVAAGVVGGHYLAKQFEGSDLLNNRNRLESGYDDTGTATNPLERGAEELPGIGGFFRPSADITDANMRRRDAAVGSSASFYKSIFGDEPATGTGGGGGGPVSTQDMQVDAGVATIQAGSVSLGGNITLPAGLAAGGGGGGRGASAPSLGSASSHSTGEDSLYGGDSGGAYFAKGGPIGTDTVPLWGTPGEWIIQKPAVDKYGPTMMSTINAGYFAGGGPIGGTRGESHTGPRGSANDPIFTMPSPGYTQAIGQQAPPRSGTGAGGGLAGLLGGGAGSDAFNAAGGIQGLTGIGQQAVKDTLGLGGMFPDPTSDPLVQSGMNMMQAALGMAMQPGGLKGALTSDEAGKRTLGGMFGGGGGGGGLGAGGGGFGMIPQVAGMPHPDDMPSSSSDAAFGDALSTRIGGGEAAHVDNSTTLNVNGFSAQEVGNQVYRNLGSSGIPNNTPRMNTNMPVGG